MCVPSHHISSSGSFSFFIAFERLLAAMQPIYLSTEAARGGEREAELSQSSSTLLLPITGNAKQQKQHRVEDSSSTQQQLVAPSSTQQHLVAAPSTTLLACASLALPRLEATQPPIPNSPDCIFTPCTCNKCTHQVFNTYAPNTLILHVPRLTQRQWHLFSS